MNAIHVTGTMILCVALAACQRTSGTADPYFGQAPPEQTPVVFAPGVISREGRFEQFLQYSPDGRELTFGVTNDNWTWFELYEMRMERGRWSAPAPASYLGEDPGALTASLSFDGNEAFFTEAHPTYPPVDVWVSSRDGAGWAAPRKLGAPVSSDGDEFEVSVARDGTLYFSSTREGGEGDIDIYRAPRVDGAYPAIENLGAPINTPSGDDLPYIAPDQSYLIFASDRPGGYGYRDLYISYREGGAWTEPVNLGPEINSPSWDIYPSVSPDGKYLFFTRRTEWRASEDSDIYWVSADFIELRRHVREPHEPQ